MEQVQGYTPEEIQVIQDNVALGEAMNRLLKNKDFKKLFVKMFYEDGNQMLVNNLIKVKDKDKLYEQLVARSWFNGYIENILEQYQANLDALVEIQEEVK